jgi:hypothetical protein
MLNKYKYWVVAGAIFLIFLPQLLTIIYILYFIWLKRHNPKLKSSPSHIQTSVAFLTLAMLTTILQHVASFNSFAYAAYSAKIVGIPLTVLVFQHRRAVSDDL